MTDHVNRCTCSVLIAKRHSFGLNFVGRGIRMSELDRLKFIAECPAVKEVLCPLCLDDKARSVHRTGTLETFLCKDCRQIFWVRRPLPKGPWK
jgi:hypothetical protein